MLIKTLRWIAPVAALGLACSGGDDDDDDALSRPDSNPAPVTMDCSAISDICLLPYPNSMMEAASDSTPTGVRLSLSDQMLFAGITRDSELVRQDGFPPNTLLIARLTGGVSSTGLPDGFDASLAEGAAVMVLNADATSPRYGERMPFFSEIFESAEGGDSLLILNTLRPLDPDSRYAVIVTTAVSDSGGAPQQAGAAMGSLLSDDRPDGALGDLWDYYRDLVYLAENEAGVTREEIALMWDFHTRSDVSVTGDLLSMVGTNRDWLGDNLAGPEVVEVTVLSGGRTRIDFEYPNPVYRATKDAPLTRDSGGNPEIDHVDTLHGILIVPSTATESNPATPVIFGHGLGANGELMANSIGGWDIESGPLAVAFLDWDIHGRRGSGIADLLVLASPEKLPAFGAVFQQSAADSVIFGQMLRRLDSIGDNGDVLDDSRLFYAGQSMGGIIGGILSSVNDDVEAAVLNVGGGGWTNLIRHSLLGSQLGLRTLVQTMMNEGGGGIDGLPDDLAVEILLAMAQFGFDPGDPINYARHISESRLPGLASEGPLVLLQESLGDGIVPNFTSESLARAAKLTYIEPGIEPIAGLATLAAPTGGAARLGITQFRVMNPGMEAHIALGDPVVYGQITELFNSYLDGDDANDGDVRYDCDGPGGNCDLLGR